jgi:hypothetical protein
MIETLARSTSRRSLKYAGISELIEDDGWERHWDDDAMVPYLLNAEEEISVSYVDAESISHKVAYLIEEDLASLPRAATRRSGRQAAARRAGSTSIRCRPARTRSQVRWC